LEGPALRKLAGRGDFVLIAGGQVIHSKAHRLEWKN